MATRIKARATIPDQLGYTRLDHAAVQVFPQYSRSRLQGWIKRGELTVNGALRRARDQVLGGELLELDAEIEDHADHESQEMPLDVQFEDEHLLVVAKPAGLVTHPAPGHWDRTLLNGLLYHAPELRHLPRAGIVHRLDVGTTGLMVVAKSLSSHAALVEQLQRREIVRRYEALAYGVVDRNGSVDERIGRHPRNRLRMAVREDGRIARTHYRVIRAYRAHSHLALQLESGRTHQIRVHMSHLGYPLIGDPLYGGTLRVPRGATAELVAALEQLGRPALHAVELELTHPATGKRMCWHRDLPRDLQRLIDALEADEAGADE